jgi:hypothetical protein
MDSVVLARAREGLELESRERHAQEHTVREAAPSSGISSLARVGVQLDYWVPDLGLRAT